MPARRGQAQIASEFAQTPTPCAVDRMRPEERAVVVRLIARVLLADVLREIQDEADERKGG